MLQHLFRANVEMLTLKDDISTHAIFLFKINNIY